MRHSVELIVGRTALNCLEIYDHHWKSSITFQKNKISPTDAVLLKPQFLNRNRKCAKLMDFFDFKMD